MANLRNAFFLFSGSFQYATKGGSKREGGREREREKEKLTKDERER